MPMLALGRRLGEIIRIGEDITVTVLHLSDSQVRLGIQAPEDVSILRAELGHERAPTRESRSAPVIRRKRRARAERE